MPKLKSNMKLTIRATDLRVTPSDTSGFLVEVECADAEDVRGQVLRDSDDGADDGPLAKRYGEVCERLAESEREVKKLKDSMIHLSKWASDA